MSSAPAPPRPVQISGAEALRLPEDSSPGRPVYRRREPTVVRPARQVAECGLLVVRTPVRTSAVPATGTHHVDEIRAMHGPGRTGTVHGPGDVPGDVDEVAHHRRTLPGWTHGPRDALPRLPRLRPQSVTGFRLARPET
ncbi:pyridoxamine 5'-phosphate oxidase family protein [Streptomyces scabiei]|uniref:pyridoxamine 5'-phosphate oxidase family protein n=1 Tax=Streptomyces scabiei TaxID=1930 RepID=UPI0038F750D8